MRVFIKYIASDRDHTAYYLTAKLDKQKHKFTKEGFLSEVFAKAQGVLGLQDERLSGKLMWLAPNHQLMDLEPVEPDDMLVIGTSEDLRRFEQTYCAH